MYRNKLFLAIIILSVTSVNAQNIISEFKKFVENADLACYEQKIQQDLNKFDKWLTDSLPLFKPKGYANPYRPGNVDLTKENKIFILAVALANTENYNFEDNIYDYLIIDSTRTFVAVCLDEEMNITGVTDIGEPGTFHDSKDNFYYHGKKQRKLRKETIKNINKKSPDLILYCDEWFGSFLYIKGEKIYQYFLTGKSKEFNEYVREAPDISIIRRSNRMTLPDSKLFDGKGSKPLFYRFTGHTPPNEVRLCLCSP